MTDIPTLVASAVVDKTIADAIWNVWASKAIAVLFIIAAAYFVGRMVIKDLRRDELDSAQSKSLLDELERKDRQLAQKERTIQKLVQDKADLMQQLSEIPKLRDEIHSLEKRIDVMVKLMDTLLMGDTFQLSPDMQREVLKSLSKATE